MSNETIIKFATFGPNRGLNFFIGIYEFIEGICSVLEKDAASAASILCRYHDVCYAHELEQKIAEYDASFQNTQAAASTLTPQDNPPAAPAAPEPPQPNPEPENLAPAPAEENPAPENPAAPEPENPIS